MLQVTINGQSHQFPEGLTINQALRQIAVEVPTLCHDDRIQPYGSCRLCTVEVKGMGGLVTACNTQTPRRHGNPHALARVQGVRKTLLGLLAKDYPAEAVAQFPDKQFHRYLREYDVKAGGSRNAPPPAVPFMKDTTHPYINVDMSQCVTCYRCVRICEEVQGQFVWKAWNRGDQTRILPVRGETMLDGGCVSCGACVDTCPSGALEDLTAAQTRRADRVDEDHLLLLRHGLRSERRHARRPDHHHPPVDGRAEQPRPHLREGPLRLRLRLFQGPRHVADDPPRRPVAEGQLGRSEPVHRRPPARSVAKHGPDSIGVLSSARGTNEENYVAQKFARVVLGTNNIDCCARVCHSPTAAAMKMTLGTGAATNSLDEIEIARTIIVCGANPTDGHPVTGARIKQAARHGANLIIVDPREIELCEFATLHLQLHAGTNVVLFNAIGAAIVDEGLVDEEFIRTRLTEYDRVSRVHPRVSPREGRENLRRARRENPRGRAPLRHGQALAQRPRPRHDRAHPGHRGHHGAGQSRAHHRQHRQARHRHQPAARPEQRAGRAAHGLRTELAGYVPIADGARLRALARAPIPTHPGLNMIDMMDAAAPGS